VDSVFVLVKGHRDHSLKQDKNPFNAQPKIIIQPGCNRYLDFCGWVDRISFSHTLMMKQHLSWGVKVPVHPSLQRSQDRSKDFTLLGYYTHLNGDRNSPSDIFPILFATTGA